MSSKARSSVDADDSKSRKGSRSKDKEGKSKHLKKVKVQASFKFDPYGFKSPKS